MAIYCIGDIHGKYDELEEKIEALENCSHIICVGDIGLGFEDTSHPSCLDNIQNVVERKNCILWILRGNHDDPDIWREKKALWSDHLPNIMLLDDVAHLYLDDVPIITVGGATSIDRSAEHRVDGETWWVNEFILPDASKRVKNLVEINGPSELLITHAGPITALPVLDPEEPNIKYYSSLDKHLIADITAERTLLSHCVQYSGAKKVLYGHYHESMQNHNTEVNYQCLAELEVFEYISEKQEIAID